MLILDCDGVTWDSYGTANYIGLTDYPYPSAQRAAFRGGVTGTKF
jgi:hypothetical protein